MTLWIPEILDRPPSSTIAFLMGEQNAAGTGMSEHVALALKSSAMDLMPLGTSI